MKEAKRVHRIMVRELVFYVDTWVTGNGYSWALFRGDACGWTAGSRKEALRDAGEYLKANLETNRKNAVANIQRYS